VKVENRQQMLVMLTIAAVALYVGVNFVFTPLQGWWSARSAQIKNLGDKVKNGQALVKRETAIRGHWANMVTNALPPNTSLAEQRLLEAVDNWSRSSGVEITSIMPQWKQEDTNYLTLNCRVETSGDIGALSRFLYDLEKGPMALRVDSVELGTHDNIGQQMTLGMDLNGLVLVSP
jgi:Tfp pilus assembly protein PilO